jgi:hypothetical protein
MAAQHKHRLAKLLVALGLLDQVGLIDDVHEFPRLRHPPIDLAYPKPQIKVIRVDIDCGFAQIRVRPLVVVVVQPQERRYVDHDIVVRRRPGHFRVRDDRSLKQLIVLKRVGGAHRESTQLDPNAPAQRQPTLARCSRLHARSNREEREKIDRSFSSPSQHVNEFLPEPLHRLLSKVAFG